ncbi:LysR family transcriptional regulator [Paraglaciecola polaris]|uniref:LysR family transcriptional regulator n=1 Tax=Paraglaciecola polaris LMG 21857 TaxID=1129793 RepID=K6ZXS3_9ALTE|nr:LysR family transcriptional regulator [Paraglaciecola polaris]GAC35027.1 LysR family transcriptional regulator [Paraglaciecola polaris LMG 21857]|tara:strand:- start:10921 stop:11856 length:936 start_codon:yes stop_codon:yes gene_type:complete
MKSLQDIRSFLKVIRHGSISRAARENGQTPAALSASLKRLEQEVGGTLIIRSTRSLRLTTAGEQFLTHAQQAIELLDKSVQIIQHSTQNISGKLQVSMPSDLGRNTVMPWLNEFMDNYPDVSVSLFLTDELSDVYRQNIDLAFRYGVPEDSGLVASPLYTANRRVLCASPAYIAKFGLITTPYALAEHKCISFIRHERVFDHWLFYHQGREHKIKVSCHRVANDADAVRRWTLDGYGIAYRSRLDVLADLSHKKLVVLCDDWRSDPLPLYMMYADRRQITPVVLRLRDFLQAKIKDYLVRYEQNEQITEID